MTAIKLGECPDYGRRLEDWDKCGECGEVLMCSIVSLEAVTGPEVKIIV